MILLVTAICFLTYVSARNVIWLRRLFSLSFLKRKQKEEEEKGETPEEFTDSWTAKGKKKTASAPDVAEADTKEEETPIEVPEPVMEPENEITLDLGGITEPQPAKLSGEEVSMIIETPVSDPAPSLHEKPEIGRASCRERV